MVAEWTDKDERQYEHIKDQQKKGGKKTDKAEEIAARTVNKQRREEDRTPRKTTKGTGNPNSSLESRTKQELYNRATQLNIKARSKMSKSELVTAIRDS
ncbi:addiction module toxin RelE [Methylophaga sp.]|uniref:addiction module toxin RelE n=1 Tax=Methylophaga sp. TaxID=2024840 RepID=UPI0025FB75D8|nr:addiction module toxin RelE [Methylophaga sp.]